MLITLFLQINNMNELIEKLQAVEVEIALIETEIKNARSVIEIAELSKTLNNKLVKKYTINFKISQLEKNLPVLGYELEEKAISPDNNPKTNKTI